ncbi:response regulator [Candidatus Aminicenantes bacterium AH-873-B07]|nr:response regulator [Candidatus Aminicenantes bacterium AH-873-B07]
MNKKVLLVDFDGNNFNSLLGILEEKKFIVIQVNDGLNALEKFQKENPDLVVLQSQLPEVHAFYFCRKVREEFKKDTPIMIISDNSSDIIKKEATEKFYVTHYFVKPCNEKDIISAILSFLNVEKGNKKIIEECIESVDEFDELKDTNVIEILNGRERKYTSEELFGDIIKKLSFQKWWKYSLSQINKKV